MAQKVSFSRALEVCGCALSGVDPSGLDSTPNPYMYT